MSVTALETALAALGHPCVVEAHERMAVLRPTHGSQPLTDDALRRRVVSLATECGFTHVAVELTDDSLEQERAGAAVSGY